MEREKIGCRREIRRGREKIQKRRGGRENR